MAAPALSCYGCDGLVPDGEEGTVWLDTPLGDAAVKTHRDQGCARRAVERFPEQPARRIAQRESKQEKALRVAAGG